MPQALGSSESVRELVRVAQDAHVPLDVSSAPTLWGGAMRASQAFLTAIGNSDYERASDDRHATDLVGAHLLQTLSSIGREHIDIYFLRVRRAVEEYQLSGALEALEMAKQEGNVRFIGLCCDGPALAALGMWQFHDAFETLLVPRSHLHDENYRTLAPMARERRVGIVTSRPFDWGDSVPFFEVTGDDDLAGPVLADLSQEHPVMVAVRSATQAEAALSPGAIPDDFAARLTQAKARWNATIADRGAKA